MIQSCEAVIRIYNTKNPSTIRDYLNAYFKMPERRNILGEKVKDVDVWRDNDDVLIKFWVDVNCEFIPGCKGSYWEPDEYPYIEGLFEINDFINFIDKALSENFADEDYGLEEDEDSCIPTEEEMLEDMERKYYEEY